MKRIILIGAALIPLLSCQVPGDRTAMPRMLPDDVTPRPYSQLLERAKALVLKANDAFYVDNWSDLEEAARGLEQTAQYFTKAEDVPAKHKDTLKTTAADLGKQSRLLREAAVAKDDKAATTALGKLQGKVREMRLSD